MSPDDDSCNFRIPDRAGRPGARLGTEATRLIVGYGIEHLGLHRIELASTRSTRGPGGLREGRFVTEGVRRDRAEVDGERVDEIVMAVLATDWKALPSQG